MIRRLWFVGIFIFTGTAAMAQVKEGKVIYEKKVNMHRDMPPEAEQFRAMMPEFQTSKMELLFNPTQSLFHPLPDMEEDQLPQPGGEGGRRMNFRFGGMDGETFRDYDKEQIVESRQLGPKTYIMEDTLRSLKWKLEEDTMTILGYHCIKATTTMPMQMRGGRFMPEADTASQQTKPEVRTAIVWYTEAIESQAGPDNFFGLPGLILKTDFNNGAMVFTALSIENSAKTIVKAPANGKKITREEYRKMVRDQMQAMGRPGGGPMSRPFQ